MNESATVVRSPAVDERTRYIRGFYIQLFICKLCRLRDCGSRNLSCISVDGYEKTTLQVQIRQIYSYHHSQL